MINCKDCARAAQSPRNALCMDCLTGALFMPSFEGATRFKIVNISLNEITEPQKALGLQNVESFQYEYLRELFHYDGAVNWQPSTGYIATLGAKIRDMIRKTICTKSTLSVDLPGFVMVDLVPMLQKEGYVVVYPFLNSFAGLGQIHRTTLVN